MTDVNEKTIVCEKCGIPIEADWNREPEPQLCEVAFYCPVCD